MMEWWRNRHAAATMLQQIIRDMYIDPELLAELDDEQKQILFCKIREEQVRRWAERETKFEEEEKKKKNSLNRKSKKNNRNIGFLLGNDGEPWTWVMGEAPGDKTIEEILEAEAQEKAIKQAEQEADTLRKQQEVELLKTLEEEERKLQEQAANKEAEETRLKAEEEAAKKQSAVEEEKKKELKVRHEIQRRQSLDMVEKMKRRRSMEIYATFKEARENITKQAEESSKQIEQDWQKQEEKAKKAEEEMRSIARAAREEHLRSMRSSAPLSNYFDIRDVKRRDKPPVPARPTSVPQRQRPSKPANRQAVVSWYRTTERPKGAGFEPGSRRVAPWFHGIISRQEAEDLLEELVVGSFLVRVSERIWGYAISYRGELRCKHFLIDTTEGSYQFFGTNQTQHVSLADLIVYHKRVPISNAGQELLRFPCPQKTHPPNYEELVN